MGCSILVKFLTDTENLAAEFVSDYRKEHGGLDGITEEFKLAKDLIHEALFSSNVDDSLKTSIWEVLESSIDRWIRLNLG